MMMQMTFYNSTQVTLWFDSWQTNGLVTYGLTVLALFAFCLLHEALASVRLQCQKSARPLAEPVDSCASRLVQRVIRAHF